MMTTGLDGCFRAMRTYRRTHSEGCKEAASTLDFKDAHTSVGITSFSLAMRFRYPAQMPSAVMTRKRPDLSWQVEHLKAHRGGSLHISRSAKKKTLDTVCRDRVDTVFIFEYKSESHRSMKALNQRR